DAARKMGADIREAIPGLTDKQVIPEVAMIAHMWATPGGVDLRLGASRDILRTNNEDVKQRNFREWVPKRQLQCHQCGEYGHIARNFSEDTKPWKEKSINGPRSERGM
ncbi:hypothetical protein A3Q56_08314, partial [Intoshia linei]